MLDPLVQYMECCVALPVDQGSIIGGHIEDCISPEQVFMYFKHVENRVDISVEVRVADNVFEAQRHDSWWKLVKAGMFCPVMTFDHGKAELSRDHVFFDKLRCTHAGKEARVTNDIVAVVEHVFRFEQSIEDERGLWLHCRSPYAYGTIDEQVQSVYLNRTLMRVLDEWVFPDRRVGNRWPDELSSIFSVSVGGLERIKILQEPITVSNSLYPHEIWHVDGYYQSTNLGVTRNGQLTPHARAVKSILRMKHNWKKEGF